MNINIGKALHYLFLCHRLPERSFFFRGRQFPVCARCTGIAFGYILGALLALKYHPVPLGTIILLLIPLGIDGSVQYLGLGKSTNKRRLLTGIGAGIATVFLLAKIILMGINHGKLLYDYIMF
ncbi:MAG: DUF2085 domain-containing protein [Desulfitobacterium hafniense]|uniref:DUF2085 domain-containing protein n=1 Tax=Desulfitobacterium hafniense TaxID=49338 RepID=UPI0003822B5E|nr:DUF2085 domain-containing protein [Desulfitobacterium hafniense]